jgi:cobaltochelatase CobN
MNKRKYIITAFIAVLLAIMAAILWNGLASTTRVALVNFQPYMASSLQISNTDRFVKYEKLPLEELNKLNKYDFVIGFGMGLKITADQRTQLEAAIAKGQPMYFYAATTPENNIVNLDSLKLEKVQAYLGNGNKRNYRNLAHYIRKYIDGKKLFVAEPEAAVESASNVLFHLDEDEVFSHVSEYENYLKKNGFYKEGAPKIAVVGGMNDPFSGNRENIDSMIVSFERAGMNIYPIASFSKRLEFLKSIEPDAVLHFPHGRMEMGQADAAVEWLKARNIPLFAPLTILKKTDEWEKDHMGMFGGFMSQSVMMPELDGAIYPYVITAQEEDKDGIYLFKSIPGRLRDFTEIVSNFISLKKLSNSEKKVAIYYFKGAGQETLAAQGLETIPALYNLLKRLKSEGYKVDNLPADVKSFEQILMTQGAVLSTYAEGNFAEFLHKGNPELIEKSVYKSWISRALPKDLYAEVVATYGAAPGKYLSVEKDGKSYLSVARVQFGNIVLLPQPMAALGDDAFAIVHGAKSPPPHTYIASYLWTQYGFGADAMIHFGTHGSLEFTPQKQVALSDYDWPDRLVGTVPHFYYYTIGNIGESVMAKRRSYATLLSYLTPPFMESNTRGQFKDLQEKIREYYKTSGKEQEQFALQVKKIAVNMGLHRDLRLDSVLSKPFSQEDIERVENFAEEIANEKMNGELYTTGKAYTPEKIHSTVMAMSADPIAYSMSALDKQRGKITGEQLKNKVFFTQQYLNPAKALVKQILEGKIADEAMVGKLAGVSVEELSEAKVMLAPQRRGMRNNPAEKPRKYSKEEKEHARSLMELERTLLNVNRYKKMLEESPELEMQAILSGLSGGYISPGSGGDAVANPNAIPTGRNMYSVNAEATPTEVAWDKGVGLAEATLAQYKKQHGDYPRKISYTFWSSEFIESEGATIAQVLYMLGVEPVRDTYGRVSDLQLIDSKTLGRPRIDVVVQTSGQFRDIAASRLALITKAVEMATSAKNDQHENLVAKSTTETERLLVEQGMSPKVARDMSTQRVFGGINGMYGTNIQGMITSGDKWESEEEIAATYINNMGAIYGGDKNWGQFQEGLLRAVLHNTDVIIQPRQNNTWGALSLDHVYEFMGGMNLAIRNVTGKDPEAYFADYRNRNNFRMQDLKEAIGVEARATVFNPAYIKEVMKGNAASAAQIEEVITNTYGWNVTKPSVIDNEMWDELYEIYVKDKFKLEMREFFERENPAVLQEITAIMLETVRKGMWKATEQQLRDIADTHIDMVKKFGSNGAGFAGSNAKLQDFITEKVNTETAAEYRKELSKMNSSAEMLSDSKNGMVLKKNAMSETADRNTLNGIMVVAAVLVAFILILFILRKKRKK